MTWIEHIRIICLVANETFIRNVFSHTLRFDKRGASGISLVSATSSVFHSNLRQSYLLIHVLWKLVFSVMSKEARSSAVSSFAALSWRLIGSNWVPWNCSRFTAVVVYDVFWGFFENYRDLKGETMFPPVSSWHIKHNK